MKKYNRTDITSIHNNNSQFKFLIGDFNAKVGQKKKQEDFYR